jgi:hypothetical protein
MCLLRYGAKTVVFEPKLSSISVSKTHEHISYEILISEMGF